MSLSRSIVSYCQVLLKKIGIYHRLKASRLYDFYWGVVDKRLVEAMAKEVEFYQKLLVGFKPGDLIFDVGANHGHKTGIFLKLGARVVAIDPDETNQQVLRETFFWYRWRKQPVVVVGKAVSGSSGTLQMWIDEPGSAKNTLSQKWVDTLRHDESRFGHRLNFAQQKEVETVSLEELIRIHGTPFFVKVDVEGHEPQVLQGLKRAVSYLSFEVNLPEFRQEGLECIEILGNVSRNGRFNYAVDCEHGMILEQWQSLEEFKETFNSCAEPSIEVFWAGKNV